MADWHCSAIDCPLHPVYKEHERKRQAEIARKQAEEAQKIDEAAKLPAGSVVFSSDGNLQATGNMQITGTHIMPTVNSSCAWMSGTFVDSCEAIRVDNDTIELQTPNLDYPVPIECFMCSHMEKRDMRDQIIVKQAKKALED